MLLFIVMKCQAHAGMSQDLAKLCLNLIFTLYWREWKSVAAWNEGACLKKKKKNLTFALEIIQMLLSVEVKCAKPPLWYFQKSKTK